MKCLRAWAITVCTTLFLAGSAHAAGAAPEKPATRWAVLVGVGRYEDDSIPALQFAGADVRVLREVLVDPARGGFPEENVAVLTDAATDAKLKPTRLNILARLRAWAELAGPKDTFLFFFSGHGIAEKGKGYLLPVDARVGILSDSALATERVDEILADSQAKATVMILDSCHSAAGKDLAVMSTDFSEQLFSDSDGRVTMASCKESQQSFEWREKGQSVYTYYLVDGLGGPADANRDGAVSVTELSSYVHERVARWAAENSRQQEPRARMNISGDVVLARAAGSGAAPAPAATPILLPAKLQVASTPEGARVLVNGKEQGRTPCEVVVSDVTGKARKHEVVIEKSGYRSEGLALELAGGEVVPLEVDLEKAPTATAIITAPSTAGATKPPAATAAPEEPQVTLGRLFDALQAMNNARPPLALTKGQKLQLARILQPVRGRETVSLAEAKAIMARVWPVLRAEQKAAIKRRMGAPPIEGERNQQRRRSRGGRPPAKQRPPWDHPLFGQMPRPR